MSVFTDAELEYLAGQRIARLATASAAGQPDVSPVVDDLASIDPWRPRGVKVRGAAVIEHLDGGMQIRITPETIWSWGINDGADTHFGPIEKRQVG